MGKTNCRRGERTWRAWEAPKCLEIVAASFRVRVWLILFVRMDGVCSSVKKCLRLFKPTYRTCAQHAVEAQPAPSVVFPAPLQLPCNASACPKCQHLPKQLHCGKRELRRSRCLPLCPAFLSPLIQPWPSDSFSTDSVFKYLCWSVICSLFFRNTFPRVSGVMFSHAGAGMACCRCKGGWEGVSSKLEEGMWEPGSCWLSIGVELFFKIPHTWVSWTMNGQKSREDGCQCIFGDEMHGIEVEGIARGKWKSETLEICVNFLQMPNNAMSSSNRYRGLWMEVATLHKSSKNWCKENNKQAI